MKKTIGNFKSTSVLKAVSTFLFLSVSHFSHAQTQDSIINKTKFTIIAGTSVVGLAASYIYVQNAWWAQQKEAFHIDHDMDYRYAKNMDKAAHFIGGIVSAELFKAGFYWTGMRKGPAYIYAGILGSLMQGVVEIKDGYAPTYGFSVGNVAAGTVGSFVPYLKYRFPALHALNIKLSYYRQHDYYYKAYAHGDLIDDYMNQTYWVALTLDDWLPHGSKIKKWYPDFLCIVGGWGVDETLNNYYTGKNTYEDKGKGNYEYYLTIDIDWRRIIPQKTNFAKAFASTLNYVKLPLPTVRFSPSMEFYWFFL